MKHPLIIERPDLQTRLQRIGTYSLTIFFWLLWLTIWMPVVTVIAWGLGLHVFVSQMIFIHNVPGLVADLKIYGSVIGIIVVLEIGWAKINEIRFTGKNRRRSLPMVTNVQLADYFDVRASDMQRLHRSPSLVVDFDDAGKITTIASGPLPHSDPSGDGTVNEAA